MAVRQSTGGFHRFTVQPLERPQSQIRLLYVCAGTEDEDCHLNMSTWDVENAPPFHAISYTWGQESHDDPTIYIDSGIKRVRKNCHYALWQTRLHYAGQHVWNDALCINQDDDQEKSLQVGMMGDIYARAASVLVCVGPHADDSEFIAHGGTGDQERWESMSNDDKYDWMVSPSQSEDYYSRHRAAIDGMMSRPYWTRVWILQEVAMASDKVVLCGLSRLQWKTISITGDGGRGFDVGRQGSGTLDVRPSSLSLERLMALYGRYGCADIRDRIYGILKLIDWPNDIDRITPNYRLSNFALAAQAIQFFSTDELDTLLSSLNINMHDATLQGLLHARRRNYTPHKVPQRAQREIRPELNLSVSGAVRIIANESRGLKIRNLASYRSLIRSIPQDEELLKLFDSSFPHSESYLENDRPRRVWAGRHIAALVCKDARPGDFLVHYRLYNTQYEINLRRVDHDSALPCLVVRRRPEQPAIFDIVGQGIRLPSFDAEHFANSGTRRFKIDFSTDLTPEDLLVLMAQDIDPLSGYGYDPIACIRRLTTDVTVKMANPEPAMVVQSVSYKPNNLALEWLDDFPETWNVDDPRSAYFKTPLQGERTLRSA